MGTFLGQSTYTFWYCAPETVNVMWRAVWNSFMLLDDSSWTHLCIRQDPCQRDTEERPRYTTRTFLWKIKKSHVWMKKVHHTHINGQGESPQQAHWSHLHTGRQALSLVMSGLLCTSDRIHCLLFLNGLTELMMGREIPCCSASISLLQLHLAI